MRSLFSFCLGLMLAFSVVPSWATDISVDGVHRYFLANQKPIQNISVINNDADRTFVIDVHVQRIVSVDPKTGETKMEDASSDFMFAPKQFVLKPKSSRSVRTVFVKEFTDNEKQYQINFSPRIQQEYKNDPSAKRVEMGASIVVTTGVSMLVAPQEIKPNIIMKRTAQGVVFKNAGNVTASLRPKVGVCKADTCIDLPKKRLSPNAVWFFELPTGFDFDWYYDVYGVTQSTPLTIAPY